MKIAKKTPNQILSKVSHIFWIFFTSNVQFVRFAARRPTQAGDATDQWRDRWNAPLVCPTQWRLPASAGWFSWVVDVDKPSVEGTPNSAIDWIEVRAVWATCEARWTWRSHAAGTSVCSWQCVTARRPAADIRARCQRYSCSMWQLLWTITETINTLLSVVNFGKMCCYRNRLVFNCCFEDTWHFTR